MTHGNVAEFARYVAVQLGAIVLEYLTYTALIYLLSVQPLVAHGVGRAIAGAYAYVAHARFTFRGHGARHHEAALKYVLLLVLSANISGGLLWLLLQHLPPLPAKLVADTCTVLLSFVAVKMFVFGSPRRGRREGG
jgi:putative flippase GtrA